MRRGTAVLLALAMLVALPLAPAQAAAQTADYQFQTTYGNSAGSAGDAREIDPTGTDAPNNAFAVEAVMGSDRTVLTFPEGNGVEVSTQGVIPNDSYTVAVLMRSEMSYTWSRILDTNNRDEGVYLLNSGAVQMWPQITGPSEAVQPNDYFLFVLTRDASDNVAVYVNGVQQFTHVDSSDITVIDPNTNLMRFFVDPNVGVTGEHSAGAVARIRLWDGPLTQQEVANLDDSPPPNDPRCNVDPDASCGGPADDTLPGTPGDDVIFGGDGNDTIVSGGGDDQVSGDGGDDELDTGTGNDVADGGSGNDRIFARAGNDLAKGGAGNDLIKMADGLDRVNGGGGRDVIDGGSGLDAIDGGKGFDICYFSSRKEKRKMKGCEEKRAHKRAH